MPLIKPNRWYIPNNFGTWDKALYVSFIIDFEILSHLAIQTLKEATDKGQPQLTNGWVITEEVLDSLQFLLIAMVLLAPVPDPRQQPNIITNLKLSLSKPGRQPVRILSIAVWSSGQSSLQKTPASILPPDLDTSVKIKAFFGIILFFTENLRFAHF